MLYILNHFNFEALELKILKNSKKKIELTFCFQNLNIFNYTSFKLNSFPSKILKREQFKMKIS